MNDKGNSRPAPTPAVTLRNFLLLSIFRFSNFVEAQVFARSAPFRTGCATPQAKCIRMGKTLSKSFVYFAETKRAISPGDWGMLPTFAE
jgi:hypothetical protein